MSDANDTPGAAMSEDEIAAIDDNAEELSIALNGDSNLDGYSPEIVLGLADDVRRLVAEVRRLRAVISATADEFMRAGAEAMERAKLAELKATYRRNIDARFVAPLAFAVGMRVRHTIDKRPGSIVSFQLEQNYPVYTVKFDHGITRKVVADHLEAIG